jgi:hypothetical protein
MLKYCTIFFIVSLLALASCYKPNIYNDGTAWEMPRELKVSNFYYDIENIIEYEGRNQEYKIKVKTFYWQDENDKNHIIESAFFIVKRYATGGNFDYAFQYRRYDIIVNEESNSGNIRNLWESGRTEIQRGSTLYLTDEKDRFSFGRPHRTGWSCTDGLYEKYDFPMYFEETYGPILNIILNGALEFRFNFPSENLETDAFELESEELEFIRKKGNLLELENNSIILTPEELENLKKELLMLMKQEKQEPKEYIEQMKNEILR